jgi:hypothetical protein
MVDIHRGKVGRQIGGQVEREGRPPVAILDDVVEHGDDLVLDCVDRTHHPERVEDVRLARAVDLTRVGACGVGDRGAQERGEGLVARGSADRRHWLSTPRTLGRP